MKTINDFNGSLSCDQPPCELTELLAALWWDAKGNWDKAHKIAQDVHTPDGAWVHAYLHRREGDKWNANYWYSRAKKPECFQSLDAEREEIVKFLMKI